MIKYVVGALALLLPVTAHTQTVTQNAPIGETSHLAFVTEYVNELSAIETLRAAGEQELKSGHAPNNTFSAMVYTSSRMQFELRAQMDRLQGMHMDPPFEELIPDLTKMYAEKVELWRQLGEIGSAFISGPKPGVDYGELGASMPKIRATLDDIDHSLFEVSPLVFATLIDQRADSKNHASHLIITKAERAKLIDEITSDFEKKLDQKDQNYTVSSASVLRAYLLKDFKSSDDPWE